MVIGGLHAMSDLGRPPVQSGVEGNPGGAQALSIVRHLHAAEAVAMVVISGLAVTG